MRLEFPCGCNETQCTLLWDDISIHSSTRSLVHECFKCPCERVWVLDYHWTDLMGTWYDLFEKVGSELKGKPRYLKEEIKASPTVRLGVKKVFINEDQSPK